MIIKEYYTVKEIADLLEVSKTTIQKIIKATEIEYDHIEKNRQYYCISKVKEIIKSFKEDFDFSIFENETENQVENSPTETENKDVSFENSTTNSAKSKTKSENSTTESDMQIAALNRMIDLIQKQLDEKDKQLAIKDKQIEDLSERLKEAMHLTKEAQFITAADKQTQLIEAAKDKEIIMNNEDQKTPKKKSIFAKIFGK